MIRKPGVGSAKQIAQVLPSRHASQNNWRSFIRGLITKEQLVLQTPAHPSAHTLVRTSADPLLQTVLSKPQSRCFPTRPTATISRFTRWLILNNTTPPSLCSLGSTAPITRRGIKGPRAGAASEPRNNRRSQKPLLSKFTQAAFGGRASCCSVRSRGFLIISAVSENPPGGRKIAGAQHHTKQRVRASAAAALGSLSHGAEMKFFEAAGARASACAAIANDEPRSLRSPSPGFSHITLQTGEKKIQLPRSATSR